MRVSHRWRRGLRHHQSEMSPERAVSRRQRSATRNTQRPVQADRAPGVFASVLPLASDSKLRDNVPGSM
jgi:hypothetical protein